MQLAVYKNKYILQELYTIQELYIYIYIYIACYRNYSNKRLPRINAAGTGKNIIKCRPRINAALFSLMRRLFEAFITKQFKYLFSSILFLVFLGSELKLVNKS